MSGTDDTQLTVMWHVERWEKDLRGPFWLLHELCYDEEEAIARLRMARTRFPDYQWRIRVVTTLTTKEVWDA